MNVMSIEHNSELKDKIKKEIEKTGFPLELYVIDICSRKKTGRMPNVHYPYDGELREIDLYTFFEEILINPEEAENPQHTTTSMVIECKKSREKPWVFFSSSMHKSMDAFYFTKYVSEFDMHFEEDGEYPLLGQIYTHLTDSHYMNKHISKCISYFEVFKKQSSPSEIYDAIKKVLSFLRHRREFYKKKLAKSGCFTEFFFPVIVLDGLLFEATHDKGELIITESDHLQLRTDYDEEIFIVDIVRKESFEAFFQSIEKDHLSFVNSINKLHLTEDYKIRLRQKIEKETEDFKLPFPPDYYKTKSQ